MKKINKTKFYSSLIIFSLIGQVAWVVENMYFNVFIYNMFGANPTQISAMVTASAIAATVTTLLMGALSDKLGKRKIFMCLGYILWGISILSFAFIRIDLVSKIFPVASATAICITLVIIMDCVMTFFGSTANDAAFNAWLTDMTDSTNRGKAEGINAMMPLVAILAVFGGFMSLDQRDVNSWTIIFSVIGVVVIIIGILGFFIIESNEKKSEENTNYFKNIFYGFRPSVIKSNHRLYIYLIAFAIFGISIQIFMPYLIIYYTETLLMQDYVFIMAPAIILASIFTVIWGRVYDKLGFNKSIIPSLSLLALGYIFLFAFTNKPCVFIGSLLMMCGYLSGVAVFGAIIRDNIPESKAGMFQGLRIIGQVLIPGVIGPEISKLILKDAPTKLIDGVVTFIPTNWIFIGALAVIVLVGAYLIPVGIKNKTGRNNK